jgi:hypothetical protein
MAATTPSPALRAEDGRPDRDTPRPAPHVATAVQADRTILLDVRGGRYFSLDEVGGRVWALLEAGLTLPEIADRLADEYDASRDRIARDVAALVERLREKRLVS